MAHQKSDHKAMSDSSSSLSSSDTDTTTVFSDHKKGHHHRHQKRAHSNDSRTESVRSRAVSVHDNVTVRVKETHLQVLKGERGPRGLDGRDGRDGRRGPEGPCGPAGEFGPEGPRGHRGEPGPEGPRGHRGECGPEGPPGPEGPRGHRGECGPEGPRGHTGECGPEGPRGHRGEPAPSGFAFAENTVSETVTVGTFLSFNDMAYPGNNIDISNSAIIFDLSGVYSLDLFAMGTTPLPATTVMLTLQTFAGTPVYGGTFATVSGPSNAFTLTGQLIFSATAGLILQLKNTGSADTTFIGTPGAPNVMLRILRLA